MKADEIRSVIREAFIEPARTRHERTITIVAREVARLLGGRHPEVWNRIPSICSVLLGKKIEEEAGVRCISVEGRCPSTTCTVTFEILPPEGDRKKRPEIPRLEQRLISGSSPPQTFEEMARKKMAEHFGVEVFPFPYKAEGWPKAFDIVSRDLKVVGDAKRYSMVRGVRIPPAKFSTISEHVWLLEKIQAERKFLVFGRDKRVPEEWLKRYGHLVEGVEFYFLDNEGNLERLWPPKKS